MERSNKSMKCISAVILLAVSPLAIANEKNTIDMSTLLLENHIKINDVLDNESPIHPQYAKVRIDECSKNNLSIKTNHYGNSIEVEVPYSSSGKQNVRCEVVIHDVLQRDKEFKLSYRFKVNDNRYSSLVDPTWFSLMQFHSFPDSGEVWRCPILALESNNGTLRMFNRWDQKKKSKTPNGTCASHENSIRSRTIFRYIPYDSNQWYKFELEGTLSYTNNKNICLTASIDDAIIGKSCGPNTFYDSKQPYLKLGVYKPTSWRLQNDIRVEYKDIEYVQY